MRRFAIGLRREICTHLSVPAPSALAIVPAGTEPQPTLADRLSKLSDRFIEFRDVMGDLMTEMHNDLNEIASAVEQQGADHEKVRQLKKLLNSI